MRHRKRIMMDCKTYTNPECVKSNAKKASSILKALSNERRLLIVCALSHGEKCVGELEEIVGISQSALSQHLAKLREECLVSTRRDAQTIYYAVSSPAVAELMSCLTRIYSDPKNSAH